MDTVSILIVARWECGVREDGSRGEGIKKYK